jgi:hypothetical protein
VEAVLRLVVRGRDEQQQVLHARLVQHPQDLRGIF